MSYTPCTSKTAAQTITNQPTKFMKTNNITTIVASVAASVIALVGIASVAVSYLPNVVAFGSVAVLVALATVDYRVGPKSYSAR